jgi:broad specificity phosphatase PhoE
VVGSLGENDRSATGYLPRDQFEAMADEFFGKPEDSIRGLERAIDAQRRIISAVERVIALSDPNGDIAIVSHGGVGTLLLCHLKGLPISRTEDQPKVVAISSPLMPWIEGCSRDGGASRNDRER